MANQKQQQPLMNMNQTVMNKSLMNLHQQPQVIKFNQERNFVLPHMISQSINRGNFRPQMVQMIRSYRIWPPHLQFRNPNSNDINPYAFNKSLAPRNKLKGKKVNNKSNGKRMLDQKKSLIRTSFNPPESNELPNRNRLETRRSFRKRKLNNKGNTKMNMKDNNRMPAPSAPRNTTSFIIRSKKSGGIAPLISPSPVTPSFLPTPDLSPSTEVLVDMAKEEWGVDGYGSMKGLIRLRSPGQETHGHDDDEELVEGGSSESDMEEHVDMERRLDHDLSRFEMVYNTSSDYVDNNVLENRVDDHDKHIAQLKDENLVLKERWLLLEIELRGLKRKLTCLERMGNEGEVINHESENGSMSRGEESNSLEEIYDEDFNGENVDM